ncbi:hypothetical protein VP01_596g7 [Puccinia sorghi]|uniref:Uncharacterized protein n=1 Tax=Puccinia sorghi TaxID=27349 RepID=A0A0L6UID5_9BASI|nr:hypothetical protein VP01_596g7 [Puccinia sorghi]
MSPLPHFLNLPLPQIPSDPSSSKSNNPQPLVFKLNLTAEQYQELLALDAEVEEGEEGGLRVEFDPSGKAALHLNPTRTLQLNPPRSGPSRTNRPEEIYRHTPSSTPSTSSSPLTGLFRIPTSTSIYHLQRIQPPSDPTIGTSTQSRPVEPPPAKANSKPSHHLPPNHNSQPPRPSRPSTDLNRSEKERIAGQRLKEKRLEDDRRKKEKQMVILPDVPPTAPATRKTRPTKPKAPSTHVSSLNGRQHTASSNTSSRNQPLPPVPASQPLPPRRALPGSQAGRQLAHGLNQHLANPSAALSKSVFPQSQPETLPPPQPLPAPAPPPVTLKPPTSNKRAKSSNPNQSLVADSKPSPTSEPPGATKLSTSTRPTYLSEQGEINHRLPDSTSQPAKPPTPLVATLKPNDSAKLSKTSPRLDSVSNGAQISPSIPEPAGPLPTHERTSSATSAHKRPVRRQALPASVSKSSGSPQVDSAPSPIGSDYPDPISKRHRPDPTPSLNRPKKTQRRDVNERRPLDDATVPLTQTDRPRPNGSTAGADDQPRKSGITVKKITVPVTAERNPAVMASHHEAAVTPPVTKKRVLDSESALPSNPLNKRARQEDGGSVSGSGLPTIRKMVRPPPPPTVEPDNTSQNGHVKKVKKKKKSKRPVDYTSSEVEEGEEPGEIVSTSSRSRPSVPAKTSNCHRPASEMESLKPAAPATQFDKPRDGPPLRQKALASPSLAAKPSNGYAEPTEKAPQLLSPPQPESAIDQPGSSPSYRSLRLMFYKLLKHYEFVCSRIEQYKQDRSTIPNLQDVEDLVVEVHGLETELDRLRNRLARNYL